MTTPLARFQSELGDALRGETAELIDTSSPGLRFTASVRRSWCEGRAMVAARTVLTLVLESDRRRLVSEYVDLGGGLEMFLPRENEAFLRFLESRLPDPSHALSLCRMERALSRARQGNEAFPGSHYWPDFRIEKGPFADLVWFHADPGEVLNALRGAVIPPLEEPTCPLLFAPRLPRFYRVATTDEAKLWARLPATDIPFALVEQWLMEGAVIQEHRD
jgi:hypothetical protein